MTISLDDVRGAALRLEGVVHRTPVVRSRQLDQRTGSSVFMKAECLQRAGAFKIRGAYNCLAQIDPELRARGVVSYSSGNHAQGVALAAQLLGAPATIFVPEDIVASKRDATIAYGARLVPAGTTTADRHAAAQAVVERDGLAVVPPYDDEAVMAGQGTVALELLQDVPDLDFFIAPIGGGGLMAGCATTVREMSPATRVIGIEAEDANDTYLSLQAGKRVRIPPPRTIADGMRALEPGEMTFEVMRDKVDEVVLVSDRDIIEAMRFLLERTKLLVEPTGAVGVAALLAGKIPAAAGLRVGVVLSGGNIDLAHLGKLLAT